MISSDPSLPRDEIAAEARMLQRIYTFLSEEPEMEDQNEME